MKHLSLILFLIVLSIIAECQVSNYTDIYVQKKFFNELYNPNHEGGVDVEGSPYLLDEYTDGRIKAGNTVYILPLRYNIYFEAFEVDRPEGNTFLNSAAVDSVYFNNSIFIFKRENKEEKVYEVLFHSDKIKLLKKHTVKFKPGSFGVPFKADVYPSFKKATPLYYFQLNAREVTPFSSFNNLYKAFPEKKDLLKQEIKTNKLKQKRDKDLIRLFKYISTII